MAATQPAVEDRNVDYKQGEVDGRIIRSEPAAAATAAKPSRATPSTPGPTSSNPNNNDNNDNNDSNNNPESYEIQHVHKVYNTIAPHFSATRHKPWPLVASFLASRPPGSLGLDVGCGNGKYLNCVPPGCFVLACDRSDQLVSLAARANQAQKPAQQQQQQQPPPPLPPPPSPLQSHHNNQTLVADGLALPFCDARADFAICIAVVHHLSTRARRVAALVEMLRCLTPPGPGFDASDLGAESGRAGGGGTAMIFVWALEQSSSRRGWSEGGEQDLLVPWVMKGYQGKESKKNRKRGADAIGEKSNGHDRDDGSSPIVSKPDQTFQRYYHLYREGELEEDIVAANGRVLSSGYDRDNWWAVVARVASS